MRRRTLSLLLALMLTAQLVLPAAAEAVELQPTEETVAQELPEEQTEETEATTEETEEATEVPEETEVPDETEETEAPTEEAEPTETEETVEETTEETVEEVEANEAADGFNYDIKNGGASITGYTGSSSVVVIPEELDGKTVLSIASKAFNGNTVLTEVVLPDTVTAIGSAAFQNCTNLRKVNLPKRLETLGASAFKNCASLKSIEIPKSLITAGSTATSSGSFDGSGLATVTFETGVTKIPDNLFRNCANLRTIDIPASVTAIGRYAFLDSVLEEVTFHEGLQTIGIEAFRNTKLSSMDLPNTVTAVAAYAFRNCNNLQNVTLSNHLQTLDALVFGGCASLKSIEIPKSLTAAGNSASGSGVFDGSGLATVTFESGVTKIVDNLFRNCTNLRSIDIPASVTAIGRYAFASSALEEITIPATVTTIGYGAFSGITYLTIKGSVGSVAETFAKENNYTFVNIGTPVASITLEPSSVSLEPKQTVQLVASVTPDAATNKALTWSSSDQGVASVDTNGLVTANKSGKATIQAEAADGSGVYAICEVTVACVHVSDEGTVVKQPSCKEEGLKQYFCVKCGEFLREETLPKTDHDFYRSETEYDENGNPYYILNCWGCDETREEHDHVLWVTGPDIQYLTSGKSVTFEAKFGDGKNHPVKWTLGDGEEKLVKLKVNGNKVTVTAASALKEKELCLPERRV